MCMDITFDQAKDESNLAKHGVSLEEAARLDWETALLWEDERKDYSEARITGLALLDDRLYCVVFTDRGDTRRIISLRKANVREVRYYASEN